MIECAPREPTEAMLNAARDWSREKYGKPIGSEAAIGCWQIMFDACSVTAIVTHGADYLFDELDKLGAHVTYTACKALVTKLYALGIPAQRQPIGADTLAEFIHNYDRFLAKYIANNLLIHFDITPKSDLAKEHCALTSTVQQPVENKDGGSVMSTNGCCRGLPANVCIARPYGCSDGPPVVSKPSLADRLEAEARGYSRDFNGHMPLYLAVTEVDQIVAVLRASPADPQEGPRPKDRQGRRPKRAGGTLKVCRL